MLTRCRKKSKSGFGLALAGLGALFSGWSLPLGLVMPGVLLLSGPVFFKFARIGVSGGIWRAYAWGWAWCCWFAAPCGWLRVVALCCLLTGVLLDAPHDFDAWRSGWRKARPLPVALGLAFLFLICMRVVVFWDASSAASTRVWEWTVLLGGVLLGVLAVAAHEADALRDRAARLVCLFVAVALAALVAIRIWNREGHADTCVVEDVQVTAHEHAPVTQKKISSEEWSNAAVVFDGTALCLEAEMLSSARVLRGSRVVMRLLWGWNEQPDPGWRVFAHVRRNMYGGVLYDVAAALPDFFRSRQVEQVLEVLVPDNAATGEYVVLIGLWNGRTNAPVVRGGLCPTDWALGSDGRVRVARIRVE